MRFLRASAICIIRALRPGRRRTAFVAFLFALFAPRFLARAASDGEADGWSALSGWPRLRGCIEIRSRFKGCEMPFHTGFTRTPCHEKKSDADPLGFAMPQTGLMPLLRWARIRKAPGAFEGSAFRTHGLPENRPPMAAKRPTFSPRLAASRLGRPANEQGHADVHALCLPVLQTRGSALVALSCTFSSGGKRLAQSSHAACAQAGMRWPTAMMASSMWQKRR